MLKRVGQRRVPWGTPQITVWRRELASPRATNSVSESVCERVLRVWTMLPPTNSKSSLCYKLTCSSCLNWRTGLWHSFFGALWITKEHICTMHWVSEQPEWSGARSARISASKWEVRVRVLLFLVAVFMYQMTPKKCNLYYEATSMFFLLHDAFFDRLTFHFKSGATKSPKTL